MQSEEINYFMKELGIIYSVVVDLENGTVDTYGDRNKLPYDSLIDTLFGNIECATALYKEIIGQITPQSWKQGDVKCVVCIPKTNIITGLFYIEHRDVIKSYSWVKELIKKLIERWV